MIKDKAGFVKTKTLLCPGSHLSISFSISISISIILFLVGVIDKNLWDARGWEY